MSVLHATVLATLLIQFGLFFWKLAADTQSKKGAVSTRVAVISLLIDWRWLLGTAATVSGWIFFVYATSLGDISLIQPLMSSGDFILVVLVVVFLGERLSKLEWIGVLITIVGAVFLAWGAKSTELTSYDRSAFWLLLFVSVASGIILYVANRRSPKPEVLLAPIVGVGFGMGAVLTKAMTSNRVQSGESIIGFSLLVDPYLIGAIAVNVIGLVLLQVAFRLGRASVVVPVQLAMANLITIAAGVFVFGESVTYSRWCGIVLIVVGTALLHVKGKAQKPAVQRA
jgi:uncharacterized membrane protein